MSEVLLASKPKGTLGRCLDAKPPDGDRVFDGIDCVDKVDITDGGHSRRHIPCASVQRSSKELLKLRLAVIDWVYFSAD